MGKFYQNKLRDNTYSIQDQKGTKNIMKQAIDIILLIFLIVPQFTHGIPMPNTNDNNSDPTICDSSVPPISNAECTCSGKRVKTLDDIILGECNHKSVHNDKFFCYVDKTTQPEKCCEDSTGRFRNTCITTVFVLAQMHPMSAQEKKDVT